MEQESPQGADYVGSVAAAVVVCVVIMLFFGRSLASRAPPAPAASTAPSTDRDIAPSPLDGRVRRHSRTRSVEAPLKPRKATPGQRLTTVMRATADLTKLSDFARFRKKLSSQRQLNHHTRKHIHNRSTSPVTDVDGSASVDRRRPTPLSTLGATHRVAHTHAHERKTGPIKIDRALGMGMGVGGLSRVSRVAALADMVRPTPRRLPPLKAMGPDADSVLSPHVTDSG